MQHTEINRRNLRVYIRFLKEYISGQWNYNCGGLCWAARDMQFVTFGEEIVDSYMLWSDFGYLSSDKDISEIRSIVVAWDNREWNRREGGATVHRKQMAAKLLEAIQKFYKLRYGGKKVKYFNRNSDAIAEVMETNMVDSWFTESNTKGITPHMILFNPQYTNNRYEYCDVIMNDQKEIFFTLMWIADDETFDALMDELTAEN